MSFTIDCLPAEIPYQVFRYLPGSDALVITMVSKTWQTIGSDNKLWEVIACSLHIAYQPVESIQKRVISSCKRYCDEAQEIVKFNHKNIIVQMVAVQLFVWSQLNAQVFFPVKESAQKNSSLPTRFSDLINSLDPDVTQKQLQIDFLHLCAQLKTEKASDEEINAIVQIYTLKGLQISIQFFDALTNHFYELQTLASLAESVKDIESSDLKSQRSWASYLSFLTGDLIEEVFCNAQKTKNQFAFPLYWCILLSKLSTEGLNAFIENLHLNAWLSLKQTQLPKATELFKNYSESVYYEEIQPSTFFNLSRLENNILYCNFAEVMSAEI